jgi:hypothetical protein
MADWVEVTKKVKKNPEKKLQFSSISKNKEINTHTNYVNNNNNSIVNKNKSHEKKYNEKDLNLIFEDTHSDYLNEQFYDLFRHLKPNSSILQNVNQSDVIDFFYDYFDIESSVKTTEEHSDDNNYYCSDEEYY